MAERVSFSQKTVQFIVPNKHGSGIDTAARAIAEALTKEKLLSGALILRNTDNSVDGVAELAQRWNDPYAISLHSP